MKISDLSIKRPVTTTMMVLLVVLLGVISLGRISLDLFPNLSFPMAAVITSYEGVGPQEIETMVTRPLENALARVTNIKSISSYSNAGQSLVVLEFNWGVDMDFAALDMREKIDLVEQFFPDEVDKPIVVRYDPSILPILQVGISGEKDQAALKELIEKEVVPRLERLEGVASVGLTGGLNREILIELDGTRLNNYGINMATVTQTLLLENMDLSGGEVIRGLTQLLVRTTGKFSSIEEIENILIPTASGVVALKDIGTVKDTFKEVVSKARLNGKPSIGLNIQKQTDANTVKVSKLVKAELIKIQEELDQKLEIDFLMDQSRYIEQSIGNVQSNAIFGGILAVLVLFIFLRNVRSTIVIATAIPISVITTFTLIYFGGLTLNMMTLGGLALGIGMLVDNAIVVLENIYRYRQEGYSKKEAASKGSQEVGMAIIASTLTTAIVFLPVIFVQGLASQLFKELALTITFSLFASLLVALTFIPMVSAKILKVKTTSPAGFAGSFGNNTGDVMGDSNMEASTCNAKNKSINGSISNLNKNAINNSIDESINNSSNKSMDNSINNSVNNHINNSNKNNSNNPITNSFSNNSVIRNICRNSAKILGELVGQIVKGYQTSLNWCLSHRLVVMILLLVVLAVSLALYPLIGAEYIPAMDQGEFTINVKLPLGTVLDRTDQVIAQIEERVMQIPEVETVFTNVGSDGNMLSGNNSATGSLMVRLKDLSKRKRSTGEVIEELREDLRFPDTEITLEALSSMGGRGGGIMGGAPVSIKVKGHDLKVLEELAGEIRYELAQIPGVREIKDSISEGHPEIQIKIDRVQAANYGLRVTQVAAAVKTAIHGEVATRYEVDGQEYDVRVTLKKDNRESISQLKDLVIPTPLGAKVHLNQIASFVIEQGPRTIWRENQVRYVEITADIFDVDLDTVMGIARERIAENVHLPDQYEIDYSGQYREMMESFDSLYFALGLAVILVYMVLASQFESLLHPFIIMFTVPLAAIGVLIGLYITGHLISVVSLIGIIMLAGIVVNNAIVLVDYINTLRKKGLEMREAILKAGPVRLRPILMTSLTTILGLLPLALGIGEGAEIQAPMAVVVISGLSCATILTLYVVPVLYSIFDGFSRWLKRLFGRGTDSKSQELYLEI